MADLAVIFHWVPRDMVPMPVEELMRWHAKAIARWPEGGDDGN